MSGGDAYDGANVVVLGGTGVQGLSVVKALIATKRYNVSVLTRDVTSPKAVALKTTYPTITLVPGSYTTESGLRTAFASQQVCYFNFDSFSNGEPAEYFWTFRAYEIAMQCGVKWFIYAGAKPRFETVHGHDEKYRNSHNIVAQRLSAWLASQPMEKMRWTILTGGVYAEMLGSMLQPVKVDSKLVLAAPMDDASVMPLVPVEMYGARVLWALRHPEESMGKYLSAGPWQVTYPEITQAVERVTGVKTEFHSISIERWMEGIKPYVDPEQTLPRGSSGDDPTAFTFRKTFGAWWMIWRDNRGDAEDVSWADEVLPDRPRTLEGWMRKVGYNGKQLRNTY